MESFDYESIEPIGEKLNQKYLKKYLHELESAGTMFGIIKKHLRDEYWRIENKFEDLSAYDFWETYDLLEGMLIDSSLIPETGILPENANSLKSGSLEGKLNQIVTNWIEYERALNFDYITISDINFPIKLFNEVEEYFLDSLPTSENNLEILSTILRVKYIMVEGYQMRVKTLALLDVENYTPEPIKKDSEISNINDEIQLDISSYQNQNYWETAYKYYNEDMIWKDVYKRISNEMEKIGLERKHKSFASFKTSKSFFDNKRNKK